MMEGVGGIKYVLVLKDDFSGYVCLVPTTEANAKTTASARVSRFASFIVVRTWVSDRISHFKNDFVWGRFESRLGTPITSLSLTFRRVTV